MSLWIYFTGFLDLRKTVWAALRKSWRGKKAKRGLGAFWGRVLGVVAAQKNPRKTRGNFYNYYTFYYTYVGKVCAHQDLNLEPTDYESVALTN